MRRFLDVIKQGSRLFFVTLVLIVSLTVYRLAQPSTSAIGTDEIRVAAVGDSITDGYGEPSSDSYPSRLQSLLGSKYQVFNYGASGTTLLSTGNDPYEKNKFYKTSHQVDAGIVVIMLGTNDSKPNNWNATAYKEQLIQFVDSYKNLKSQPMVYLMTPPAAYTNNMEVQPDIISQQIVPIVESVAQQTNSQLIDIFGLTQGRPELFSDDVHPNADGYQLIAEAVYNAIR